MVPTGELGGEEKGAGGRERKRQMEAGKERLRTEKNYYIEYSIADRMAGMTG